MAGKRRLVHTPALVLSINIVRWSAHTHVLFLYCNFKVSNFSVCLEPKPKPRCWLEGRLRLRDRRRDVRRGCRTQRGCVGARKAAESTVRPQRRRPFASVRTARPRTRCTVRAFPIPYPVRLNETPVADACGCPCVTNPSGRYRIAMAADAMRNRLQRVASRRRVWQTAQCTGFGSSGLVTATRRCRRV